MPASKASIIKGKKDQEEANFVREVSTGHSYPSGGETSAIQGLHMSLEGLRRVTTNALLIFS